jgi:hypothetical protein
MDSGSPRCQAVRNSGTRPRANSLREAVQRVDAPCRALATILTAATTVDLAVPEAFAGARPDPYRSSRAGTVRERLVGAVLCAASFATAVAVARSRAAYRTFNRTTVAVPTMRSGIIDDASERDLPDELSEFVASLTAATGDLAIAVEVDWQRRTVSVVGRLGSGSSAPPEDSMLRIGFVERNVDTLLEEYDVTLTTSRKMENGFLFEFDVSAYLEEPVPDITRVTFD